MFEYIFTIGCFDKLHKGHILMLEKIASQCEKLIIGIYNNKSIQKKKNITDIQNIEIRKKNLKPYAFDIFEINDLDPTCTMKEYIEQNMTHYHPIRIGDSRTNTKKFHWGSQNQPSLFFTNTYQDTFTVQYTEKEMHITRTDKNSGWGQKLKGYPINWCFMRANDNPKFPGFPYISSIMPVRYLDYTPTISSSNLRNFTTNKIGLMNYLLKKVSSILDENDIPYYLDCGTLLGCIREHGLMEKDTDIDVAIHLSMWEKLKQIDFSKQGLIVTRILQGYPHKPDGNMISVRTKYSRFYCDIYAQPAFPLLTHTTMNGETYSIPIHPEIHLQALFGSNWRIPSNKHSDQVYHRGKGLVNSEYSSYWDPKCPIFKCIM